jgi:superfamily II DNA or RNA helicase/HKD family nuclease
MQLKEGLYDLIISGSLEKALAVLPEHFYSEVEELEPSEAAATFADAARRQLVELIDELREADPKRNREQLLASAVLVNELLVHARARAGKVNFEPDIIAPPPRRLLSIGTAHSPPIRPETGLSVPWLFTAGKGTPSLLEELRREMVTCDSIDILVSFITVSGVRKIYDLLEAATSADATGITRTKLRILTTTYTGATEQAALDRLASLPGTDVRISLDGRRTRLHAKAWIFSRRSGFGSAYAGSANLSGAALLGGLEWTVKFTERGQSDIYERARAHFETLWEDPEFQHYDPSNPSSRESLRAALERERGGPSMLGHAGDAEINLGFFSLSPKTYQLEMLEQLKAERERGRWRNLVVAATGTGKTIVAAFDYLRTTQSEGGRPRLLFIAHTREILEQSRRTFREVLRDHSFGEILAEGKNPENHDFLFATIQSAAGRDIATTWGNGYWHTVVFDECHRLAAESFDALVRRLKPKILLGLTATPERSDGKPIYCYFDNRADGSPAVELRLWTAMDLQLLAPFEYYGCDDEGTDFSDVPWDKAGEELAALDRILTGNEVRARLVVNEWLRLTGDAASSKALAFCVSVNHARYMNDYFNRVGFKSLCLVGATPAETRRAAPGMLERGELNVIVTCDLFNEGVDIPAVNTILLLRPTQSPVLFQQQIGRGLRLFKGKDACLVLDFVGRFRNDFRIDLLYRSITGLSRTELEEALEKGFSRLPAGCSIHLERQPRSRILSNLRSIANQNWPRITAELMRHTISNGRGTVRLLDFLSAQKLELRDIYKKVGIRGWTALKRAAALPTLLAGPEDTYFGRRFEALCHVDDRLRIKAMEVASGTTTGYGSDRALPSLVFQMLAYQIDGEPSRLETGDAFLSRLRTSPALCEELGELAEVLREVMVIKSEALLGLEDSPLALHASYSRREILTALEIHTAIKRPSYREGVLSIVDKKIELLFITLDKRSGFHASIAYHDYAISPDLFHWQSQNSAGPDTMAGRRYLESYENGWRFQLFIRRDTEEPYIACGPVQLESWSGDRPLSIVWRLRIPLAPTLFRDFNVLRDS